MRTSTTDMLICGAGAAGLTLAIDLARRNIRFRIVEQLPAPFEGSRGKGIKPRTQEVFEDLGVIDRIVAAGGLYPPDRDYEDDGSFIDSFSNESSNPTPAEPYLLPLMVPQFLTEAVLRNRLAEFGAAVEFNTELKSFEQSEDEVTASVRSAVGDELIRARFLVGADGGKSFVRHALGVEFPGKTLGVRAIVADVLLDGLSHDVWHRWASGDMRRQLFVCPLRGTAMFQIQGPIASELDVDLSAKGLTELVQARTNRTDIVVRDVKWASAFHMNARLAERYRVGCVFLCGDSAHVHPPTGGQGLNTSIQDAYNLGWKLASVLQGDADASLLDSYEEERRPIAQDMLGLTTRLLQALKDRGDMRRGRDVQQLDLGYAGSIVGWTPSARTPDLLIAGDRAPDVPLMGRAGQPVRLFDVLKGPHWTLLGFETDKHAEEIAARKNLHIHRIAADGDLVDVKARFATTYGVVAGDRVLIRPDGYIAAIGPIDNLADFEVYLRRVGLNARCAAE
jgi:2-polyprenyl-6-methoxyphenol hydroxylase-like FAD-dependent oxidoreductase